MPEPRIVTYQVSDLARHYREVVDNAKHEDTLIRDKDGETLVMLSLDRAQRDRSIAGIASDFTRLLRAVAMSDEIGVVNSGRFSFTSLLPADMRSEMVDETYAALQVAQSGGAMVSLHDVIEDWIATAEVWADTGLREEIFEDANDPPADVLI
jgi:hypothetical protein